MPQTEQIEAQHTTARVRVLEAMRAVTDQSLATAAAIERDRGLAWVWRDPEINRDSHDDRAYAAWAIAETDYLRDDQPSQDTLCAPGVVTVSRATRAEIDKLNATKLAFRDACRELKQLHTEKTQADNHRMVSDLLRSHGFPRVSRRQAYRLVTIVDPVPDKISFSWCAGIRTRTLDRRQTEHLIQTTAPSDEAIGRYLDMLHAIDDTHFVEVRRPKQPHPRANLRFGPRDWRMVTSPLPLCLPDNAPEPEIKALPATRAAPERHRAYQQLCRTAWITELGLYRYQSGRPRR